MIKYSRHKLSTIPVLSPTKSFAKSNQPEGMLLADALDCWDLLPHVDFLGCSSNFLGLYIRWPGHIYFKSSSWIVNCWVDTTYTTGGRIVFFSFPGVLEDVLTSKAQWQGKQFQFESLKPGTITIEHRSCMAFWFMCHTWGLALSPAELQGGQGQGHDDKNINNKKWIRTDLHVRKAESLEGSILLSSEVWQSCSRNLSEATFCCLGVSSSKGFRLGPGLGNLSPFSSSSNLRLMAAFCLSKFLILSWLPSFPLARLAISSPCLTHSRLASSSCVLVSCNLAWRSRFMPSWAITFSASISSFWSSLLAAVSAGKGNTAPFILEMPSAYFFPLVFLK